MKRIIFILLALFLLQINVALASYGTSDPCYGWGSSCNANDLNIYIKNSSKDVWDINWPWLTKGAQRSPGIPSVKPGTLALFRFSSKSVFGGGDGISGNIKLTSKGKTVTLFFNQILTIFRSEAYSSSSNADLIWPKKCENAKNPIIGNKLPGMCQFTIN